MEAPFSQYLCVLLDVLMLHLKLFLKEWPWPWTSLDWHLVCHIWCHIWWYFLRVGFRCVIHFQKQGSAACAGTAAGEGLDSFWWSEIHPSIHVDKENATNSCKDDVKICC